MEQLHIREPQAKMPMAHFRIMQLEPDKTVILQTNRQITVRGSVQTLPQAPCTTLPPDTKIV